MMNPRPNKYRSGRLLTALAVALAGILGVSSAFGTTTSFDNSQGDNDWANSDNWDNGAPDAGDIAGFVTTDEAVISSDVGTMDGVFVGSNATADGYDPPPGTNATVRVTAGGLITTTSGDSSLHIGRDNGLNGTWLHEGGTLDAAGEIRIGIGDGGTGLMDVSAGTVNATHLQLGREAGTSKSGTFNLSGTGDVNLANDVWVLGRGAGDAGTGEVNVSGGTLTATGLSMGREETSDGTATMNVSGGTVDFTGGGSANRNIWLNGVGQSGVDVALNISGGSVSTANSVLAGTTGSAGTTDVNVTGTGSFDVIGDFHLGTPANNTGGAAVNLLLSDQGSLTVGQSLNVGHSGGETTATVTGGTLDAGLMRLGNKDSGTTSSADAHLVLSGGSTTIQEGANVGDSTDMASVATISVSGDASFSFGGSAGMFVDAGEQTFTVEGSNATITGSGAVDNPSIHFSAGNNVEFIFDASGISAIDLLSDLHLGSDQIDLIVDASLAGLGDYTLFTFDNLTGYDGANSVFGTEDVTLGDPNQSYTLNYNTNDITLSIIPEPSTYALIFGGLALAGVLLLRRRKA